MDIIIAIMIIIISRGMPNCWTYPYPVEFQLLRLEAFGGWLLAFG